MVTITILIALLHLQLHLVNVERTAVLFELTPSDYAGFEPRDVLERCNYGIAIQKFYTTSQLTTIHRIRGDVLMMLGKYADAEQAYGDALSKSPSSNNLRIKIAQALVNSGKFEAAQVELAAVLRESPDCAEALTCMAAVLFDLGKVRDSIKNLDDAIKIDSGCAYAYYLRGLVRYATGDYLECIDDITAFLKMRPRGGSVAREKTYILRAKAYFALGKNESAVADFLCAREIAPKSRDAVLGLWRIYSNSKRHKLALETIKGLAQDSNDKELLFTMASSLISNKNIEQVDAIAKRCVLLWPDDCDCHRLLGSVYFLKKDYKDAKKCIEDAVAKCPGDFQALFSLSAMLSSCPDEALRDGKRARMIAKRLCADKAGVDPHLLLLLARAEAECGEFDAAVRLVERVEDLPIDGDVRANCEKWKRLFESKKAFRFGAD